MCHYFWNICKGDNTLSILKVHLKKLAVLHFSYYSERSRCKGNLNSETNLHFGSRYGADKSSKQKPMLEWQQCYIHSYLENQS